MSDDPVVQNAKRQVMKAALRWRLSVVLREDASQQAMMLDNLADATHELAQLYPGGCSEVLRDLEAEDV